MVVVLLHVLTSNASFMCEAFSVLQGILNCTSCTICSFGGPSAREHPYYQERRSFGQSAVQPSDILSVSVGDSLLQIPITDASMCTVQSLLCNARRAAVTALLPEACCCMAGMLSSITMFLSAWESSCHIVMPDNVRPLDMFKSKPAHYAGPKQR